MEEKRSSGVIEKIIDEKYEEKKKLEEKIDKYQEQNPKSKKFKNAVSKAEEDIKKIEFEIDRLEIELANNKILEEAAEFIADAEKYLLLSKEILAMSEKILGDALDGNKDEVIKMTKHFFGIYLDIREAFSSEFDRLAKLQGEAIYRRKNSLIIAGYKKEEALKIALEEKNSANFISSAAKYIKINLPAELSKHFKVNSQ